MPLKNIKVLIPRPIGRTDEMAEKLIKLNATPIIFPLIEIESINKKLLKDTHQDSKFDWILFTSGIAVQTFFDTISPKDVTAKIAVVGTATKKTIEGLGLKVDFIPSAATAKKLVKEIPLTPGEKILIPRSKIAGKGVLEVLKKRKADVTEIATYNNTPIDYDKETLEKVLEQNINVITFTSGSTVESFVKLLRKYKIKLEGQHIVSIGPSTTSAAKKLRLDVEATAEEHNIDGLIETIKNMYQ